MLDRRDFLKLSTLAAAYPHAAALAEPSGIIVNDIHSQLNSTRVRQIVESDTLDALRNTLSAARRERRAVCIAGGRHAMGAQAFATDGGRRSICIESVHQTPCHTSIMDTCPAPT